MKEIEGPRKYGRDGNLADFMLRTLNNIKWTVLGPGVRASAQCDIAHGSKNLFQRAIVYRHKKIFPCQRRLQAISNRNYVYFCNGFINIAGLTQSFGLASRVAQDIIIVFHWIAAA